MIPHAAQLKAMPAAHGPAAARLLRVHPWRALSRRHDSTARSALTTNIE
jgi:hypothetical protein